MTGMRFRSHVLRPLDPNSRWNVAIVAITLLSGGVGALLTLTQDRGPWLAVEVGGAAFLSWAVARELDPDHQLGAMAASLFGAVWALVGGPTSLLPFIGLLMASRLLVGTTGRRPLVGDLAGMAVLATLISYTPLGWVMGSGLALAIYVDDRMSDEHGRQGLLAALGAAIGATAVVTLTDSLPDSLPPVDPLLTLGLGLLAIVTVVRMPAEPVSFVDSRSKAFLRADRLQAGRAVAGLLIFAGSLVQPIGARSVIPMAFPLVIALVSDQVERLRRARRGRR